MDHIHFITVDNHETENINGTLDGIQKNCIQLLKNIYMYSICDSTVAIRIDYVYFVINQR